SDCPPDLDYHCSAPADLSRIGFCVSWHCSHGETDPLNPDTDGDGVGDKNEGGWICDPPGELNPDGLKIIKYVDSTDAITYAAPNWKIAIEPDAFDGAVTVAPAQPLDSAYIM